MTDSQISTGGRPGTQQWYAERLSHQRELQERWEENTLHIDVCVFLHRACVCGSRGEMKTDRSNRTDTDRETPTNCCSSALPQQTSEAQSVTVGPASSSHHTGPHRCRSTPAAPCPPSHLPPRQIKDKQFKGEQGGEGLTARAWGPASG